MRGGRYSLRWLGAALALVLALPVLWIEPAVFFAGWLVAWWYCLGLVLGALVDVWLHRLTGGRWGIAMQPVALLAARRLPWLLLLFLPLAAGLGLLYPWAARPDGAWAHELSRPGFVLVWLSPGFFWLRMLVYAAVWWLLCRPATLARKGASAAALVAYALVGTLAAVDLLESLVPGWFSTAFGLVVLSGQALGGTALVVLCLARWAPARVPAADGHPPVWRDFGNLLLMWLMTWAYLAFMEFLIIWAENLPREIAWYVPRLQTGWQPVAVALVVLQLAVPLLLLLWRSVKDRPARLAGVAALLLGSQLLNTAWLVIPSVAPHSLLGWWVVPALALAFGLALFGGLPAALRSGAVARPDTEVRHARP
jgi:hypothetical protein